jgi:hypothetical protein
MMKKVGGKLGMGQAQDVVAGPTTRDLPGPKIALPQVNR